MSEKERAMLESIGGKIQKLPEEMKASVLQRLNDVALGAAMVYEAQGSETEEE